MPGLALSALSALVLVLAFLIVRRVCERRLTLPTPCDEIHFVTTADGWRLALYRYRTGPAAAAVPGAPPSAAHRRLPVLVCHGLGANRFNVDFDERTSWARHARRLGFDSWVIELRGHGASQPADGRARDHTFDDFVLRDVPAIIEHVRAATGAPAVHWLGHSMGGMVAYGYLGRGGTGLATLMTVSSPVHFPPRRWLALGLRLWRLVLRRGRVPQRAGARLAALFASWLPSPFAHSLTVDRRRIGGATIRRALWSLVDDLSAGELRQFESAVLHDRFLSLDGAFDYREGIREVTIPLHVVASVGDYIAPPAAVTPAFDLATSQHKQLTILSAANGQNDFGHGDLIVAADAPQFVFPLISAWLSGAAERGSV